MPTASRHPDTALAVFLAFLKLGCSAFGGPIAHLGYFRDEFVRRRGWLSESSYADLVALCQFLPGPASSQVGMALGLARAGYPGALAAWLGFTLPSALLLVLFALGLGRWGALLPEGVLHGLKIAAVAVVAQAVWGMGRSLCPDRPRLTLMALSCASVLAWPTAWTQVAVIAGAGLAGRALLKTEAVEGHERLPIAIGYRGALLFLTLFAVLLVCLPLAARLWPEHWLRLLDAFYRAGSLVFGGGHVVLPLLQAEVVPNGWVDGDTFLAGYAAAQAVPGPLFTFAAFLGAASGPAPNGWSGALLCLLAIFLPSFLLVAGALPFWERLRHERRVRATLAGVNAAVVGLLLAALYQPLWTEGILRPADFALLLFALLALLAWKTPPWQVVLACAVAGGPQRPQQVGELRSLMSDERWRRGYAELARHGLHFDLQTPWWNLAEAACLARDFPDTLIVLNHAGLPSDRSDEGLAAWQRAMARFAECPNVALKISGIGQAGRRWSVEDNAWIVRESIALFGVERAMFASNFPVDSLCGSFDDIYGGFKRIVADLPYADQERLFHSNARRIYRTVPDTVRLQQASLDPRTSP